MGKENIEGNIKYYQIFHCKVTFSSVKGTSYINSCFRSTIPVFTPYGRNKSVAFNNEAIKSFIINKLKIKHKIEILKIDVINYLGNSI